MTEHVWSEAERRWVWTDEYVEFFLENSRSPIVPIEVGDTHINVVVNEAGL